MTISGGSPVPQGAGVLTGTNKQSYYAASNAFTITNTVLPNDGVQHYLVSCSMSVWLVAGTISGVVVAQAILSDNVSPFHTMAQISVYCNGFPTSGVMPGGITELAFPGGIAIQTAPNLTNQLSWLINVAGVAGGSVTSPRIEGNLTIAWT